MEVIMRIDILIQNSKVFNVYLKRFIEADVAVLNGRFFYIGRKEISDFDPDVIINADGKWLVPGLVDIHLHIESSMVVSGVFARALVKNGVTTVVAEPHEIANVFGVKGVVSMIDAEKNPPADIYYGIPSCVPASDFEDNGGQIGENEMEYLLHQKNVVCLGEVMSYTDVINRPDSRINGMLSLLRKKYPDVIVEGHCPKLMGFELASYIYAGVDSDHTEQTPERMAERIQNGMFLEIQEKSLTKENIDYLRANEADGLYCFVTDDVMADTFVEKGHLNRLVKKAVSLGLSQEQALYAATYSPAQRMGLRDRGAVAPGKLADFTLLDDLCNFTVSMVFKKGKKVYDASDDKTPDVKKSSFPPEFYHSVRIDPLCEEQFKIKAPSASKRILCRIIKINDNTTFTEEASDYLNVLDGNLDWESSSCCLAAVFNRYGHKMQGYGLIGGNIIKKGAVATTYAHDSHNLLVVGRTPGDMTAAANRVIKQGGGICAVEDGKVITDVGLPVAGIMSDMPIEQVGAEVADLKAAMIHLGYSHQNPVMSLCTISLPVSPALKLTDRGLVDVKKGKIVSLFIDENN